MTTKKSRPTETAKITGYKGFNEHLQCTPEGKIFQYEVGKTYTHKGNARVCKAGFHFCDNPFDVLSYYPPTGRFAEVIGEECDSSTSEDYKHAARRLTIKAELSLTHFLGAGIKFILDRVEWKNASATNTGEGIGGLLANSCRVETGRRPFWCSQCHNPGSLQARPEPFVEANQRRSGVDGSYLHDSSQTRPLGVGSNGSCA
jgi:hypothetical protein